MSADAQINNNCSSKTPITEFYLKMVSAYSSFLANQKIKANLPYTPLELLKLYQSTCITVTNTPIIINGEKKDAANAYPYKKWLQLYKPTWEAFRNKYDSNFFSSKDMMAIFKIIHHEAIPYYIKKSDPLFENSYGLYEWLNLIELPKKDLNSGAFVYLQKQATADIGFYLGNSCAITLSLSNSLDFLSSLKMEIMLGFQNPQSSMECMAKTDINNLSNFFNDSHLKTIPDLFIIHCEPLNFISDGVNFKILQHSLYRNCKSDFYLDENFKAYVSSEIFFMDNDEIKITFNFFRNDRLKPDFSFSNTYIKYKKVPSDINPLLLKVSGQKDIIDQEEKIVSYPINKWVYVNLDSNKEVNCQLAETYIENEVNRECDFMEYILNQKNRARRQEYIFLRNSQSPVRCSKNLKTKKIFIEKDNACIITGEKIISL